MKTEEIEKIFKQAREKADTWANYNLDNDIHYLEDQYWRVFTNEVILLTKKQTLEQVKKEIDKLEEPSNRFNLGLNNQEALAYFNGYEDTKKELKQNLGIK